MDAPVPEQEFEVPENSCFDFHYQETGTYDARPFTSSVRCNKSLQQIHTNNAAYHDAADDMMWDTQLPEKTQRPPRAVVSQCSFRTRVPSKDKSDCTAKLLLAQVDKFHEESSWVVMKAVVKLSL